jgi:hypothetical protein
LNDGQDTLLGSLALFFAVAPVLILGIGLLAGNVAAAGCVILPMCVASVLFSVGALLERGRSRTFPLVSLALVAVYLLVLFEARMWGQQ